MPDLVEPASWSYLVGFLGKAFVILSAIGFIGSAFFAHKKENLSSLLLKVSSGLLFSTFLCLLTLFVTHQFQYLYVYQHTSSDLGLEYKIAGVWSGQEGSFLLWACCSALFGIWALPKTGKYKAWFTIVMSGFLALLSGILIYESPFQFIDLFEGKLFIPPDGAGLSPTLINYWVVIHPPVIFLGFGSLTILYAWAIAALFEKDLESYIPQVRPWTLISLTLLGVGLCMGGFWAYETLGWGGFWKWDPVENTSFVPWAILAAFIHGIFIQQAKKKGYLTNIALASLPFLSFVYGTFLTRSGFLGDTSVHSFAEMDSNALWMLIGIGVLSVGLFCYAFFAKGLPLFKNQSHENNTGIWNKEFFYNLALWLLVGIGLISAIGMSVPLMQSLAGKQPKMVDEHLYHQVFAWPYPILALAMGIAPFLTWRNLTFKEVGKKFINILSLAIGTYGILLIWMKFAGNEAVMDSIALGFPGAATDLENKIHFFGKTEVNALYWVLFLAGLTSFAIFANLARAISLWKKSKTSIGGLLTHVGVLLSMFGLIYSRGFEKKAEITVNPAQAEHALGHDIKLLGRTKMYTDRDNKIELEVTDGRSTFTAKPGLYFMEGRDEPTPMQLPYIHSSLLYDLYFVIHPFTFAGSDPAELNEGEIGLFKTIQVKFNGYKMEGEAGMVGTKFIADVDFQDQSTGESGKAYPAFEIVQGGPPEQAEVDLGNTAYRVKLARLDAATGAAALEINYKSEAFPLQVYYKPLTRLVWWGVGIMGLGGLLSAYSRRYKPKKTKVDSDETS